MKRRGINFHSQAARCSYKSITLSHIAFFTCFDNDTSNQKQRIVFFIVFILLLLLFCFLLTCEPYPGDFHLSLTGSSSLFKFVNFEITRMISDLILQAKKFLKCDWLRPVVFEPNLKYLHVKITVSMQT